MAPSADVVSSAAPERYTAFISYSHRDRKCAEWVHRWLESFSIPAGVAGSRRHLRPVFIDRAELSTSSDLAASVRESLAQSRYLIVVCSPHAAASRWVNEEVRFFKALGRSAHILCVIASGEPPACFPPALRFRVEDGEGSDLPDYEPLAADLRPGMDDRRSACLKLAAGLLGVPLDRLRHRDQARRAARLAIIATGAGVGCVVLGAFATAAVLARNEAERQRLVAEQKTLTAQQTSAFLKSLFQVSDPSEARGNSVTAREVLDRGAQRIGQQLQAEPQVRAELTTTLGEVYAALGLLPQAQALLTDARRTAGESAALAARQDVALGELHQLQGNYDAALAVLTRAAPILVNQSPPDYELQVRVFGALGDVYQGKEDYATSRKFFQKVLDLASRHPDATGSAALARALEGVAQADLDAGSLDAAAHGFERALATQIAATGEMHPRTSELLNELGGLEYTRRHFDAAIGYFRRALAIDRRVLGDQHPEVGITLNNLGRLMLERRRFSEARALLTEAIAIRSGKVVEASDHQAFAFSNLALVGLETRRYDEAEDLFRRALTAAIAGKQRLRGPILTDLADLECRTGRYREGLLRLDEARPLIVEHYPDVPWRMAHLDNVRAGCLAGEGKLADAARMFAASTPVVLEAWPADSIFGHDALEREARLKTLASQIHGDTDLHTGTR